MLIVFTGNGKGKTTAALGQAIRAIGHNKKVLMIQFIKGPWKSGEDYFGKKFHISPSHFQIKKMGLGFVGILGDKLPRSAHKKAAQKALKFFRKELNSKKWDMIILDEVNIACSLGLLKSKEVLSAVGDLPSEKIVIFTGRNAPKVFIQKADLVTEMREIKHHFAKGNLAKATIDF